MLRDPRAGDNISADWAMELVREIRRNRPIQGENIRLSPMPNGTVIHGTPGGSGGSSAASAPGCFAIKSMKARGGVTDIELKNPYYRCAGRTFTLSEEVPLIFSVSTCVVALEIDIGRESPRGSIKTFGSLDQLQGAELGTGSYIAPLYLFVNGKLECDFRLGVETAMGEFLP